MKNNWPENEREKTKEIANSFTIFRGAIFLKEPLRLYIPYNLREKVFKTFHECPLQGAHLGTLKTLNKIKSRFYWDKMNLDIKKLIAACKHCQERKSHPSATMREPMLPIPVPTHPFARIHVDICGPLPKTMRENKYILSIIDSFSKWLTAVPMTD